jgi:hypothetical protein
VIRQALHQLAEAAAGDALAVSQVLDDEVLLSGAARWVRRQFVGPPDVLQVGCSRPLSRRCTFGDFVSRLPSSTTAARPASDSDTPRTRAGPRRVGTLQHPARR